MKLRQIWSHCAAVERKHETHFRLIPSCGALTQNMMRSGIEMYQIRCSTIFDIMQSDLTETKNQTKSVSCFLCTFVISDLSINLEYFSYAMLKCSSLIG